MAIVKAQFRKWTSAALVAAAVAPVLGACAEKTYVVSPGMAIKEKDYMVYKSVTPIEDKKSEHVAEVEGVKNNKNPYISCIGGLMAQRAQQRHTGIGFDLARASALKDARVNIGAADKSRPNPVCPEYSLPDQKTQTQQTPVKTEIPAAVPVAAPEAAPKAMWPAPGGYKVISAQPS